MVGRQETSGGGALQDSRRARLVPVTVMKSPSSFEVSVEVFSSGMSISNKDTTQTLRQSLCEIYLTKVEDSHSLG